MFMHKQVKMSLTLFFALIILQNAVAAEDLSLSVVSCSPCYVDHGVENSLDGNPDNNYTAFKKSAAPFEIKLSLPKQLTGLYQLTVFFESAQNYSTEWLVEALDADGKSLGVNNISGSGQLQKVLIELARPAAALRLSFRKFSGQPRLLLRQIGLKDFSALSFWPVAGEKFAVKVLHSSAAYKNHGIENSLDGDPFDDYSAFVEQKKPSTVSLLLSKPMKRLNLNLLFESAANYATDWQLELLDSNSKVVKKYEVIGGQADHSLLLLTDVPFSILRFSFSKFKGQQRLLLRNIKFYTDFINDQFFQLDTSVERRENVTGNSKSSNAIVSVAKYSKDGYLMTDYQNIYWYDDAKKHLTILKSDFSIFKKEGKNCFYQPTGVAVDAEKKVYIANYRGNNVLQGRLDLAKKSITWERDYRSKHSISPENVTVDLARKRVYSANYDGGTISAFDAVSGKELWAAPVPQAHGVVFDQDYVYAVGLDKRNIVKIDSNTGKIVLESGGMGWNPVKQQFMWPVTVDILNDDTLIVADAQNGFISLADKKTLQVKSFFGGNGMGHRYFNYPYTAKVLDDEVWISSAFRPEIVVLDRKTLKGLRRYFWRPTIARGEHKEPFGVGWEGYINKRPEDVIELLSKKYQLGFAQIHHADNIFYLPFPGTLYCPWMRHMYMLQYHIENNVTFIWSSSLQYVYMLVADQSGRYASLWVREITVDSWKDGDSIITQKERLKFADLARQALDNDRKLKELQKKNGIVSSENLKQFFEKNLSSSHYSALFNKIFSSYAGVQFKQAYDHYRKSAPDKVRAAARLYFGRIAAGSVYKNLDEYLMVSMLTGVSPLDAVSPAPPRIADSANVSHLKYFQACVAVSGLKPYGEARGYKFKPDMTVAAIRKNIEPLADWHCGVFALRFCMELPAEAGAVCYELQQPATGAVHTVVEVREPSGTVTYDPTQGCVYLASVKQLCSGSVDMEQITYWSKAPEKRFSGYQGANFFFKARERKQTHLKDIQQR